MLLLTLVMTIDGCSGKREKLVVNNPGYKEKPRSLEIKSVECNDTATILNMVVSGPPKNWVRLNNGTVLSTEEFSYGESFDFSVFPKIPNKDGYYGYWNTTDLTKLVFDTNVEVIYKPYVTALVSEEKRDNGRVIFLVEGEFTDSCKITASSSANAKKLELLDKFFSNDSLIECWTLEIPTDNMENNTVHFLPRNDHCKIFINVDGAWQEVETTAFGSYLLFDVSGETIELAIVEHTVKLLPLIIISAVALLAIGTITAIVIIKKKKANA